MSFQQIYFLAIAELQQEFNFNSYLVKSIQQNQHLKSLSKFIYDQLISKQHSLIVNYKDKFNSNINNLSKQLQYDYRCGFVINCYGNGYKEFCNISHENHNDNNKCIKISHTYQKKNMNHIVDQKYQEDLSTICIFIYEMISLLINKLIREYLLNGSTLYQLDLNDHGEISKYDQLVQNDQNYFRSNYLKNGMVSYFKLGI